jgi:uncharacterized protein (TIGR00251 family)
VEKFYKVEGDKIFLKVRVQPNASKTKIVGLYQGSLKIAVQAPPVEGAANKELIKFFNKKFKIPKTQIELKGEKSRNKELTLPATPPLLKFLEEIKGK